ncbi:metallophosphoesterase family protein [Proteiniborus sp.]|uniref:metallophosphoesterase family protein n=1 Tax=Proteiniborus sp. TaxID=2079015 RepID=UPI00332E4C65
MKIGIISDTHIKKNTSNLAALLNTHFKEVDLIIHAGDYISADAIEILKDYKNFVGVWGNVDESEIKTLINENEIITIDGYKIGIFHGHGTGSSTFDRAYDRFKEDKVDIIIFGHSHQPLAKTKNGVLILNPGSLTRKRRERWFSYIILELHEGSFDLQFRFFS